MIGIGLATATAGVIVGTVTLTGVGQVMADLVEFLSGGNLILMLVMVGLLSLVLGMGLPTTANYIVVSSLMAGVVVELGAQSGLIVPLIAVHLFVFYFGIMADVTPPVGLASFAAAAVSGGELRLIVSGPDFDTGETKETTLVVPVTGDGSGDDRLTENGFMLFEEDGAVKMDEPMFGTPFADTLSSFDFYGDEPVQIAAVKAPANQMAKEWVFIPALLFLGFIAFLQRARMTRTGVPA